MKPYMRQLNRILFYATSYRLDNRLSEIIFGPERRFPGVQKCLGTGLALSIRLFLKMINFFGKAIVLASAVCGGTEPVVITKQESPTGCLNAPSWIAGCRLHVHKAATGKSVIETQGPASSPDLGFVDRPARRQPTTAGQPGRGGHGNYQNIMLMTRHTPTIPMASNIVGKENRSGKRTGSSPRVGLGAVWPRMRPIARVPAAAMLKPRIAA